jgi:asparagine synthase (glutamine-hydrolysing)
MSHGLEVRCPFLDHRLVEFCCALPPRLKLRRGRGKWLLRRAARGLVPAVARRRRKSGFNAPVAHWLAGPWREVAGEALNDSNLGAGSVVDAAEARRLLDEHVRGRANHGYLLFALVMLGLWLGRTQGPFSRRQRTLGPFP